MSKWSKNYFADLAERVGSTAIYGLIALLTATTLDLSVEKVWPILGLPVALALLKGLLANLANPESGASALPSPPGPEVDPDADV